MPIILDLEPSVKAAPMLVMGGNHATLWVPIPDDPDGHCDVYRAYPDRTPDGRRIPGWWNLWRYGKPSFGLRRDLGGIVTCGCRDYWIEGDCRHVLAAIETGLV